MKIEDVNVLLETINGGLSILIAASLLFLLFYIIDHRRNYLKGSPSLGMTLAIPMAIIKLGLLISFSSRWYWRFEFFGNWFPGYIKIMLITGSMISSIGFIWLLRILSRPRFGDGPWLTICAIFSLYLVVQSM